MEMTENNGINGSTTTTLRPLTNQMGPLGNNTEMDGRLLSTGFSYFAALCFILIIVISVFCNVILMWVIISEKKLHCVTHVFIINLAVSDLFTAVGTVPFDVDFMLHGKFRYGRVVCGIMHFTFLISLPSSVLNLTLLTAERLISVRFPYRRAEYLNKRNIILAVILTWVYTFSTALFPMFYEKQAVSVANGLCSVFYPVAYDIFQLVANFFIPILFICSANLWLFYISSKHAKKMQSVRGMFKSNQSKKYHSADNELQPRRKRTSFLFVTSLKQNMKAAKRLALLVGVFLFCWLTYIILVTTNISCGICHPRELTWIGNIINYSSSAINPVLYGLLNRTIRQEIMKCFCNILHKCGFNNNLSNNNRSAIGKVLCSNRNLHEITV